MLEVNRIINQHAAISFGIGALPFPVLDMVALSAVQLTMIKRIGDLYEDKITSSVGNKIISTLIASVVPYSVAQGTLGSLIKGVPLVGGVLGLVTYPVFASASTLALGNIFKRHYEKGGTVIDFNPAHYASDYVNAFRKEQAAATAATAAAAAPAAKEAPASK